MAATVSPQANPTPSNIIIRRVKVTGDNSYPAGGYAITAVTAAQFRVNTIHAVHSAGAHAGYSTEWDYANGKLKVYRGAGAINLPGAEPTGVDLSAVDFFVLVIGE